MDLKSMTHASALEHTEGGLAKPIEEITAKLPSDTFLWMGMAALGTSLTLRLMGNRHDALFVGQWVPTLLIMGLYNKIVKVAGHDQIDRDL